MASYVTTADFKADLAITDSSLDTLIGRLLDDASRALDRWCEVPDGHFAAQSLTRVFDITAKDAARGEVQLPALLSVTTVKTDDTGDGVYETTWSASTDYVLYPLNTTPKTSLQVNRDRGRYSLPAGQQRLQIVGSWGEAETVPSDIRRAVILQANRWRYRSKSPEGMAGNAEVGFVKLAQLDPDVAMILERGRRRMPEIFA